MIKAKRQHPCITVENGVVTYWYNNVMAMEKFKAEYHSNNDYSSSLIYSMLLKDKYVCFDKHYGEELRMIILDVFQNQSITSMGCSEALQAYAEYDKYLKKYKKDRL